MRDVDALADRLAGSPFRTVGPPANLSFSDKIRAMQVVGPAREVLYLTQISEPLAAFDTPVAASDVDRVFIVILGGTSLDALQDYYHEQFGVAKAPVMPSVVSVISARFGLPRDYKHPIAALQVRGQCYIEADLMPAQAAPRPCDPGQLKFTARQTEVVVLGPDNQAAFVAYWRDNSLPFIGLPDPKAVVLRRYGQEVKLFKLGRMPAQVIVDKKGVVRYAHYGHSMSDIPKNREILALLDQLNQ